MSHYEVIVTPEAKEGLMRHQKSGNKKLVQKIFALFDEISEHPRSGTGKPEQLKGRNVETWSRRADSKHRIVYEIRESILLVDVVSTYGHYDDK